MKKLLVMMCLAAAALPASAQVYKCKVGDKTAYQDQPCGSTQRVMKVSQTAPAAPQKENLADMQYRAQIMEGIRTGYPVVGMKQSELSRAMGSPVRVNSGNYGGSTADQLIYNRNGRTIYVYVRDGVVSSYQDTEGIPTRQKSCPTEKEVEDWEFDKNLIKNRDGDRQEKLQNRIDKARKCWRE